MAHGTCGQEFKDAFSCFVYSKAEPRGTDCFENFSKMQQCIVSHPEEYGPPAEPEPEPAPTETSPATTATTTTATA